FRGVVANSWGWMLFSGIVDLVLAAIIIAGLPGTAAWTLGLLVGINLLMAGLALVMTAIACRGVTAPAAPSVPTVENAINSANLPLRTISRAPPKGSGSAARRARTRSLLLATANFGPDLRCNTRVGALP